MTPLIGSTSVSIRKARLLEAGLGDSGMKIYCEWKVVDQSGRTTSGRTKEEAESGANIPWKSTPVKLANVSSIEMLRKCTVKVVVKQPNQTMKILWCAFGLVCHIIAFNQCSLTFIHDKVGAAATRRSVMAMYILRIKLTRTAAIRVQSRSRYRWKGRISLRGPMRFARSQSSRPLQ